MRKLNLLAAAAAAAVLAGCGLGAPSYPQFSNTAYRIEGNTTPAEGGASTRTIIYRDGPKMRVEAVLPHYGQAAIVFDESTNSAYVLNPTTRVPTTTTTTTPQGGATTAPSAATGTPPPSTTTTATPAGVAVRLQEADAPQPLEAAWAALGAENARSTGRCEVTGEQGREWTPRAEAAPGVQRTACITDDGIVLRVRENDRVLWEATALQRGAQNPTLFGVPPGYRLIDPQAVADQVGENLEQLDSVTGQRQPAPAAAPQR